MLVGCAIENGTAHFRFTSNSLTLAFSLLQGDKVGKDYLLQNLYRYKRTSLSNGKPHSTLEKTHFIASVFVFSAILISGFAAWQFRVSFIVAVPSHEVLGDGVEASLSGVR